MDELNKSVGQNAGPLNGQSIIFDLKQSLHSLASYTGGAGSFTSMTDLGLSFDTNGHLNFDPTALSSASGTQFSDLASFLGGASSGGFLQFATNVLNGVEDPTSGSLKTAIQLHFEPDYARESADFQPAGQDQSIADLAASQDGGGGRDDRPD